MLGSTGLGMIESFECACNITGDGNVAGALDVIEVKSEATVLLGIPIDAGCVEKPEGVQ